MPVAHPHGLQRLQPGRILPGGTRVGNEMDVKFTVTRDGHPWYLDGNQYSSDVDIVPDGALAGVRWTLEAKSNGSWRLKNQGGLSYGLTQQQDRTRLAALHPDLGHDDPMADWLIYLCGREQHVLMRPVGGVWLVAGQDTGVQFDRVPGEDPARSLWELRL